MKRSSASLAFGSVGSLVSLVSLVLAATSFSSVASAQGTMTPSQPPPPPVEVAPTPTQPPAVQQAQPAQPTESEPPAEDGSKPAPKARTGFQIAIRTGASVPLGEVDKGEKLSDFLGVQVPVIADIGAKVIPNLFVGGYVGFHAGATGDTLQKACDAANVDCLAVGFRIGVQAQLHFIPDGKVNPWIGYGIGYEIAGVSGTKGNDKLTAALGGVEFGHFMAGLDFRLSRVVGIGPFADFALGQYSIASIETTRSGVTTKRDGDIAETSLHEWLTLGVKLTFFP